MPLEEGSQSKKKSHSRMPSLELAKNTHQKPAAVIENPKERAKFNLVNDYGNDIDNYLKNLAEINGVQPGYLSNHKITGVYRAKMVDWMVEVLTAFKCAD
jgi:hypothetical protein